MSAPFGLCGVTRFALSAVPVVGRIASLLSDLCAIHRFASGFEELDEFLRGLFLQFKSLDLNLVLKELWRVLVNVRL